MDAHSRPRIVSMLVGAAIVGAASTASLLAGQYSTTEDDRLLLGSWTLNLDKSRYPTGRPPRSQTRTYEARAGGVHATVRTVLANGQSTTVQYTAADDNLEHPVTGSADADKVKLTQIAPRTAQAGNAAAAAAARQAPGPTAGKKVRALVRHGTARLCPLKR